MGDKRKIQIEGDLAAWKEPDRDAWEIRDGGALRGQVVQTSGGFQALRPGPDGDSYSVGTFISLETAARALKSIGSAPS